MNIKKFLSKTDKEKILQAIKEAEHQTSGEIRVHLESKCSGDALQRAVKLFEKLKMHRTEKHNGTLIYLAVNDRKLAIFGDEGINKVVPENFWNEALEEMRQAFAENEFVAGLTAGIKRVGQQLKQYFPYQQDDVNELSDDISFGE